MVKMGSTILYLLVFCLCFHSTVSFNETFKHFQYQDILRHAAQIGHFDYQQHISANLQKVEVVKNLFYDPELNQQNSKALTPWKLLHDGAQTWKSSNSSIWSLTAGCTEGIQETVQGLKQRSPWAIRSKYDASIRGVSITLSRGHRTSVVGGTIINGGSRISHWAATPKGEGMTTYYFEICLCRSTTEHMTLPNASKTA